MKLGKKIVSLMIVLVMIATTIFGINISNLKYLIKLIDRYGIEIAKKGKNCYYSPELKQKMRF